MMLEERLDAWQQKYGPIPEDATHLCMIGEVIRADIKKIEGGKVYAQIDGRWDDSCYRVADLNDVSFWLIKHRGELI